MCQLPFKEGVGTPSTPLLIQNRPKLNHMTSTSCKGSGKYTLDSHMPGQNQGSSLLEEGEEEYWEQQF